MLIPLAIWDLTWKGLSLWNSAKHNSKKWFVALLIVNSAGLLPIIYHFYFREDSIKNKKQIAYSVLAILVSIAFSALAIYATLP